MGACNFDNLVVIKGTPNEAYNEAREDMRFENGHQDGYSGDIQTSHGFSMVSDAPRYGTKAFENWEERKTENMYKGDCKCIELKGAVLKRLKERRGYKGRKGIRAFYFFGVARC